jgi:hypothetical protein
VPTPMSGVEAATTLVDCSEHLGERRHVEITT